MREKLIDLIEQGRDKGNEMCGKQYGCDECQYKAPNACVWGFIADRLIANGVTIQKWIPITEKLPDTIPCGAGTAYSEAVNVLTTGRKVLTAIWDGTDFIADAAFWEAEGEEITHWTHVLLPLPEPPKGE